MIEKERQSELIRKFVVSQEMPDDEIADLSLDELTYIYFNTEIAKKDEKYKAIHFPIKQQIIYWGVVDAIKKAVKAPNALEPPPTQATRLSGSLPVICRNCSLASTPTMDWKSLTILGKG